MRRGKGAAPEDEATPQEQAPIPGLERPQLDLDLRESRRAGIRERLRRARRADSTAATPEEALEAPANGGRSEEPEPGGPGWIARALAAAGSALASVGALVGRAAAGAGSVMQSAWDYVLHFWLGLSVIARRRIAALAGLALGVALVVLVLVPLAPCWVPGGDRCPPADDAVALVPESADGYLHVNLDPETDQVEDGSGIAERLPALTSQAGGILQLATDRAIDYERDVAPWSGGELGFVLDSGLSEIERTLLLEVAGSEGANEFADNYLRGGVTETDLDGITLRTDARGTAAAIAGGFLIIGDEAAVRETVEVARDRAPSIAEDPGYQAIEEELPDERIADAWLSPPLAMTLFSGREASLRPFDTFVNADATEGVAASLSLGPDDAMISVRSSQDPKAPVAERDFFTALPPFEPTLADSVGADALAYLGLGSPAESARALVERAAATAPDLFEGLKRFNRKLGRSGGIDLERDLLPSLQGEAALTVEPERGGGGDEQTPGVAPAPSIPYLALIATGVDVEQATIDLAELQGPIAAAVDPGSGQAPVFETSEIAGVEAQSLRLSPVVDLTYAGWDDEIVVGTSPDAVARARSDDDVLADSDTYRAAIDGLEESLSMLLYVNTRSLLDLGERLFLGVDPTYATLAPDLRTLEAGALGVTSTDTQLATDLRLIVGQPILPEDELPPIDVGPGD